MPPEHLSSNMWKIPDGEYVEGIGGRIDGPKIVRITTYSDPPAILVQSGKLKVEIQGTIDFSTATKKK